MLVKIYAPGFFARGDTATPVKVGFAAVGLNIALNLLLIQWMSHVGVALATALSAWFNAAMLGWLLNRRGQMILDRRLRRNIPRLLLAAALMAGAILALRGVLFPVEGPLRFLALAALVAAGGAVYFGVAQVLGAINLREVRGMLRRRRKPAAAPAA